MKGDICAINKKDVQVVSLVAFVGGWVVWHSITPVVTLDNPSTARICFEVLVVLAAYVLLALFLVS